MTDTLNGQTFEEWATGLFEFEVCADCGGDVVDHEPWIVMGNWFAHCKNPVAFYAVPGDENHPATQWLYQTGNVWMAVRDECEGCWFEDGTCEHGPTLSTKRTDWPTIRRYPIDTVPPAGTLRYLRANGADGEFTDAAEVAALFANRS